MKFRISETLDLPDDAVTQKMAFIGRTGAGKSYAVGKLVEEMLDARRQVVILDPVGIWYGLRMAADGGSGIAIPVLGGLHGDVPLESTAGALIADLVVDKRLSVVVDVSQFESDAEKARFATDFASRLFFRKKAAPSPIHLVIEECQEFMPQNLMRGDERMLHAFQRMWKLGRNFGIGGSLISQRPQEVSKKVLNQTECLFAFQMTGPQERKAIETWMAEKGVDQDIAGDLPSLKVGQCHVWSPQWLAISEKIVIAKKRTLNSSSTPTHLAAPSAAHQPAEINLEELSEKMAATIERAKADDPKELRKEIAALNAKLIATEKDARKIAISIQKVEVPVLDDKTTNLIRAGIGEIGLIGSAIAQLEHQVTDLKDMFNLLAGNVAKAAQGLSRPVPQAIPSVVPYHAGKATRQANGLGAAERAFLTVLSQRQGKTTARNQIAVFSGYSSKSSHVDNTISALRTKGLISGDSEAMLITSTGCDALGDHSALPQGRALIDYWIRRTGKAPGAMLNVLVNRHPESMGRDDLATAAGYSPESSHVDNCIGYLRTLELITGPKNALQASDDLFA